MGGAFLYTYFKITESNAKRPAPTPPASNSLIINVDDDAEGEEDE